MKINKYLLYLLFVPAFSMTSCSDYEDTEVTSPQADEDALGANFTAATSAVTVNPDKGTTFTVTLNRVNTTAAATVPVKVEACSEVAEGEKFCEQPTAFVFAAGEAKTSVTLKLSAKCKFQTTYSIKLSIGGNTKDHLYAAGTSLTTVSVIRDYKWVSLGQPVLLEKGWYNGGILTLVQWASDYIGENPLFKVGSPYYYAGLSASTAGSLQFFLDYASYDFTGMLNMPGEYESTKINTGIKEDGALLYMNVTQTQKVGTVYTFTYDLYSVKDGQNVNFKQGITADLDFDIKSIMEE